MPSNTMQELLELTVKERASDLHLSLGHPPVLRISGRLVPLIKKKVMTEELLRELATSLMTEEQVARLEKEKEMILKNDMVKRL